MGLLWTQLQERKRNKINIVFVAGSLSSAKVPAAIPKKLKKKHQTKQSNHTRDDGKGVKVYSTRPHFFIPSPQSPHERVESILCGVESYRFIIYVIPSNKTTTRLINTQCPTGNYKNIAYSVVAKRFSFKVRIFCSNPSNLIRLLTNEYEQLITGNFTFNMSSQERTESTFSVSVYCCFNEYKTLLPLAKISQGTGNRSQIKKKSVNVLILLASAICKRFSKVSYQ